MAPMSTASDLLAKYLAAEMAILDGQSYRMGERMLTLADLAAVQKERTNLERRVQGETNSGGGARHQVADFS
jgi:hypothetical protein